MPATAASKSSARHASAAALIAPAEVPAMTGKGLPPPVAPASLRTWAIAFSTPTWYAARAPPPVRMRPVSGVLSGIGGLSDSVVHDGRAAVRRGSVPARQRRFRRIEACGVAEVDLARRALAQQCQADG